MAGTTIGNIDYSEGTFQYSLNLAKNLNFTFRNFRPLRSLAGVATVRAACQVFKRHGHFHSGRDFARYYYKYIHLNIMNKHSRQTPHSSPTQVGDGGIMKHWVRFTLILAWINNNMPSKMWDKITFLLTYLLTCCTVEVWEMISNLITHFIMDAITYKTFLSKSIISWHFFRCRSINKMFIVN